MIYESRFRIITFMNRDQSTFSLAARTIYNLLSVPHFETLTLFSD